MASASTLATLHNWRVKAAAAGMPRAEFDDWLCRQSGATVNDIHLGRLTWRSEFADLIETIIARLNSGKTLAQALGYCEFMGEDVLVDDTVLSPRPESSLLCELVLGLDGPAIPPAFPKRPKMCELGVGSGALTRIVAAHRPHWDILATDCSPQALAVARRNLQGFENVDLRCLDWLNGLQERFDCIFSNPPYVQTGYIDAHPALHCEPRLALDGGVHGLTALETIIDQSQGHLNFGGWLFLEHGNLQWHAVAEKLTESGFTNVQTHTDINGHKRVTGGQRAR